MENAVIKLFQSRFTYVKQPPPSEDDVTNWSEGWIIE